MPSRSVVKDDKSSDMIKVRFVRLNGHTHEQGCSVVDGATGRRFTATLPHNREVMCPVEVYNNMKTKQKELDRLEYEYPDGDDIEAKMARGDDDSGKKTYRYSTWRIDKV